MNKQSLLESLDYIKIKRGPSRALPLDAILVRRMEDFLDKRLSAIKAGKYEGRRDESGRTH